MLSAKGKPWFLISLFLSHLLSVSCPPDPVAERVIKVDGIERRFLLDVSPAIRKGGAIILAWHGFGDSPEHFREYLQLRKSIDGRNLVIAYPEGRKDKKGKRNHSVGYKFQDPLIDDVKFAHVIVEQLVKEFNLSRKKVFSTGMSNGADMSFLLARQRKPLVQAVAPIAGTMMVNWDQKLKNQYPISVMAVHGKRDNVTKWEGDLKDEDGWGAYLPIEEVAHRFAKSLSLKNFTAATMEGSSIVGQGKVEIRTWAHSDSKTEYVLYVLENGKHVWPLQLTSSSKPLSEMIFEFFEKHGLVD